MKLPFFGRLRGRRRGLAVPTLGRSRLGRVLLGRVEHRLECLRREESDLRTQLIASLSDGERAFDPGVLRRYQEAVRERRHLAALLPHGCSAAASFVFSSWLLRDSFRICTATADEGMHFAVGIKVEGLMVGVAIAQFSYAERSPVRAAGAHRDTHALTIDASESGHRIVGIFHSHPGHGPHANFPSGTDLTTHELWERASPLVGGIWSRSGHLRFFSAGRPFTIRVAGTHMEQIDAHQWKLRDEYLEDHQ